MSIIVLFSFSFDSNFHSWSLLNLNVQHTDLKPQDSFGEFKNFFLDERMNERFYYQIHITIIKVNTI